MDAEQAFLRVHTRLSGVLARVLAPRFRQALEYFSLFWAIILLAALVIMHSNFVGKPACASEFLGADAMDAQLIEIKIGDGSTQARMKETTNPMEKERATTVLRDRQAHLDALMERLRHESWHHSVPSSQSTSVDDAAEQIMDPLTIVSRLKAARQGGRYNKGRKGLPPRVGDRRSRSRWEEWETELLRKSAEEASATPLLSDGVSAEREKGESGGGGQTSSPSDSSLPPWSGLEGGEPWGKLPLWSALGHYLVLWRRQSAVWVEGLQRAASSLWKELTGDSNSWAAGSWAFGGSASITLDANIAFELFRGGNLGEPSYIYSVEKGYLMLSESVKARHNVRTATVNISTQNKCFGSRWQRILIDHIVGYDTIIINSLLHSRARGYLYNLQTKELKNLTSVQEMGATAASFHKQAILKIGVLITSLFVFFTTTMSVSFTLRETQARMYRFTVQLQHHARNRLPTFRLIFTHIIESLVFVPIMIGILFFLFEFFEDQLLAFMVLTLVWLCELFTMISVRTRLSMQFFPLFFFLFFMIFHFYFFSFTYYGFSYLAFFATAAFMQHSVLYFWNRHEVPVLQSMQRRREVINLIHHHHHHLQQQQQQQQQQAQVTLQQMQTNNNNSQDFPPHQNPSFGMLASFFTPISPRTAAVIATAGTFDATRADSMALPPSPLSPVNGIVSGQEERVATGGHLGSVDGSSSLDGGDFPASLPMSRLGRGLGSSNRARVGASLYAMAANTRAGVAEGDQGVPRENGLGQTVAVTATPSVSTVSRMNGGEGAGVSGSGRGSMLDESDVGASTSGGVHGQGLHEAGGSWRIFHRSSRSGVGEGSSGILSLLLRTSGASAPRLGAGGREWGRGGDQVHDSVREQASVSGPELGRTVRGEELRGVRDGVLCEVGSDMRGRDELEDGVEMGGGGGQGGSMARRVQGLRRRRVSEDSRCDNEDSREDSRSTCGPGSVSVVGDVGRRSNAGMDDGESSREVREAANLRGGSSEQL